MDYHWLLEVLRSVVVGERAAAEKPVPGGPRSVRLLTIEGMSCGHCAMKVRSALEDAPGVETAQVDMLSRTATVKGVGFNDADLAAAVAKAGYRVSAVSAGR